MSKIARVTKGRKMKLNSVKPHVCGNIDIVDVFLRSLLISVREFESPKVTLG